jgi:hypothetical protein
MVRPSCLFRWPTAAEPQRAVQIAFACLRWGYMQDRFISAAIRAEAVRATTAYIAPFVTGVSPEGREGKHVS